MFFFRSWKYKKSFLEKLISFFVNLFKISIFQRNLRNKISYEKDTRTFSSQEGVMLRKIIQLHQARVDDLMIPRSDIEAIEINTQLSELLKIFKKSGHSRIPIYKDTLDDPRGMIHIRDLLNYITCSKEGKEKIFDLSEIDLKQPLEKLNMIREVLFVPGSMLASQLLSRMQSTRTQMALVIDEYGGTDGLISMEDIVELVVGDIEDEHDDNHAMIITESEDSWIVDARTDLEDIQDLLGVNLNKNSSSEDISTIGGFIVSSLERIPSRDEVIKIISGYHFYILDADQRRIRCIRIRKFP